MIFIFDMDNCVADDRRRIPMIDWEAEDPDTRYRHYHAACGRDPIGNANVLQSIKAVPDHMVIFVTARPGFPSIAKDTADWIDANIRPLGINVTGTFMRKPGDQRASVDIKREAVHQIAAAHPGVEFGHAFDDREDIVAMYREEGIAASRLWIHDECAWTRPEWWSPALLDEALRAEGVAAVSDAPFEGTNSPRDALLRAIEVHDEREAVYGANYETFGEVMARMFPAGATLRTVDEWARMGVLVQIVAKVTRYAQQFAECGHIDSARDGIVYSAILQSLTERSHAARAASEPAA